MNNNEMKSQLISAEDKELVNRVLNAKLQIIFFGTAVSNLLAEALVKKAEIVKYVYLDCDELCYRNGYGDVNSIEIIKNAGITVYEVPNVRVNILALDNIAIVYSPLPLVIEDEACKQNATGVLVSYDAIKDIVVSSSPVSIPIDEQVVIPMSRKPIIQTNKGITIPKEISQSKISNLNDSIKKNPIAKFSITKEVNVYSTYIGFIEIKSTGLKLKSRTIRIPEEIVNTKKNSNDQGKLKASYTLFNEKNPVIEEVEELQQEIEKFRNRFSYTIKNYGSVFIKSETAQIEEENKKLIKKIEEMNKSIQSVINKRFDDVVAEVTDAILPLFPDDFKNTTKEFFEADFKKIEVKRAYITYRIYKENERSFKALNLLNLKIMFKNVTYSMIQSKEFMSRLMKHEKLKAIFKSKGFIKEKYALTISNKDPNKNRR